MPQDSSSPLPEVHPPTLEEVLEGLRWLQRDWFDGDEHEEYDPVWRKLADAIAFLESPERAFRCRDCGGPVEAL